MDCNKLLAMQLERRIQTNERIARCICLLESSHTETEFKTAVQDWWRLKSGEGYLWEVAQFANLNPEQETWLADCIKETHGETAAGHYKRYISPAYRLARLNTEFEMLELLCKREVQKDYIESFCSVCERYGVFTEAERRAAEKYCCLIGHTGGGEECCDFWEYSNELRAYLTKREFVGYLDGIQIDFELFCGFFVEVADVIGISPYQVQWFKEYVPKRKWSDEFAMDIEELIDESETATAGESTAEPQPDTETKTRREILYQSFLDALTPKQRARAEKYFPRAIKAGFMTETASGYQWRAADNAKAQIAWFMARVLDWVNGHNYTRGEGRFISKIDKLFGVNDIRVTMAAINNLSGDTRPFETEMEKRIFCD